MAVIDNAVYVDGRRMEDPPSLAESFEAIRDSGGFGWIGLYRPTHDEIAAVGDEFGLHALAVEDALKGHQRPKLERFEDTLFVVLRPALYRDDTETVEFGELHVFVGKSFVATIRHADSPDLGRVRQRMQADPALLARGPEAVLYGILDEVVDGYAPVIAGLENDIDEIEDELFEGEGTLSERIYKLAREVIGVQRASQPLVAMVQALLDGAEKYGVDVELQRNLRDVHDHVLRIVDRADAFRAILQNALTVEATLVGQRQNEEMKRMTELGLRQSEQAKKISSWAAILFAPTLIGGIYGMNFRYMPELEWPWGYPFALGLMAALGGTLYVVFKKKGWL